MTECQPVTDHLPCHVKGVCLVVPRRYASLSGHQVSVLNRHCALQICLLGSRDEFVVSGSDDGRVFIWDQASGRLVNMLSSDDRNVSCVAANKSMPMLASAGSEPVVKLWSPQVRAATP